MHTTAGLLALAAAVSSATAAFQGFNYGSTFTTGAAKAQSDFEAEFKTAKSLAGTNGAFSSARLYTMIQAGTPNTPISAIPAALNTKTSLLLGMWCSAGPDAFANELQALKSAISNYGNSLGPLVAGISVGSEDLYRITPTGIMNKENPGAGPDVIANYIKQVRDAIAGTPLSGAPVGHVDTWTAWVNGSNKAVIDAVDWVGVDAYPYFQNTMDNGIENNKNLFNDAVGATQAAVGGKPVWVTETGFPVSGKTSNKAVPSVENAKTYWDQVGCPMFGKTNVWWYTMEDAAPDTPNPSFGLIGSTLSSAPLYDLSCQNVDTSSPPPSTPGSKSGVSSIISSGTAVPTVGGGSPGAGGAVPSSQASLESSPTPTGGASPTGASGNGTVSGTGKPNPSPSTVNNGGPVVRSGSMGAAFAAIMLAMLVL